MCIGGGGKAPKPQPAIEPMKNVEAATNEAGDAMSRKLALRRGMMSLYTRYNDGSAAASGSGQAAAVAAKSDKLGG